MVPAGEEGDDAVVGPCPMLVIRMTLLRGATRQLCAAAQTRLRDRHGTLLDCGDELKIIAALLSRLVGNQGRDEEAMKFVHSAKRAAADDVKSQALWRDADRCAGWLYSIGRGIGSHRGRASPRDRGTFYAGRHAISGCGGRLGLGGDRGTGGSAPTCVRVKRLRLGPESSRVGMARRSTP